VRPMGGGHSMSGQAQWLTCCGMRKVWRWGLAVVSAKNMGIFGGEQLEAGLDLADVVAGLGLSSCVGM